MNSIHNSHAPRQSGVTLVELMVSLVLALLLTAGMIKVFSGNRVTYEFNQSLSRIQENARFALNHISYSTRMAGYRGCISDIAVYNNLQGTSDFMDDIETGLEGYEAVGTGKGVTYTAGASTPAPSWSPALPTELAGEVLAGSDVLVVRGVDGDAQSLVSPFSDSSQFFIADSDAFNEGEILVATDCQKASIFQLTNITNAGTSPGGGTAKWNLVHSNAGFTPGNTDPTWGPEQEYGLGAQVARLQAHAFYVGEGDNGPGLFQLRLQLQSSGTSSDFSEEELVPGIESLQVRYGIDTDADLAIDEWKSADLVTDWERVVSVEISLLARAPEEYGTDVDTAVYDLGGMKFDPVDDRRLRQVFSTAIGVRNRLP